MASAGPAVNGIADIAFLLKFIGPFPDRRLRAGVFIGEAVDDK
jgi:hypothetical protein